MSDWEIVEEALGTGEHYADEPRVRDEMLAARAALARLRDDYDGKAFLKDAAEAKCLKLEQEVARLREREAQLERDRSELSLANISLHEHATKLEAALATLRLRVLEIADKADAEARALEPRAEK